MSSKGAKKTKFVRIANTIYCGKKRNAVKKKEARAKERKSLRDNKGRKKAAKLKLIRAENYDEPWRLGGLVGQIQEHRGKRGAAGSG